MAFMQPQVTERTEWWECEGDDETFFAPYADHTWTEALYLVSGEYATATRRIGYGARLSAPGYLDCTEWAVFDTVREAVEYLRDVYQPCYLEDCKDTPECECEACEFHSALQSIFPELGAIHA